MDNQRTCGQGLAERSVLPARMGQLIAALAENLESHRKALDVADEGARQEDQAYAGLAERYRRIAGELQDAAARMDGYRDLPMGRHDPKTMASPEVVQAFEGFVSLEQDLLTLLQQIGDADRQMLAAMRGASSPSS